MDGFKKGVQWPQIIKYKIHETVRYILKFSLLYLFLVLTKDAQIVDQSLAVCGSGWEMVKYGNVWNMAGTETSLICSIFE